MKIVMLANNPCVFDARIRREAEALAEAGHEVVVLATSGEDAAEEEQVAGVDYRRILKVSEIRKTLRSGGDRGALKERLAVLLKAFVFHVGRHVVTPSIRHLFAYARAYTRVIKAIEPDVVHAHDLDTLLAGWLGAKRAKAKLVYDAHELETDRNLPMVRFEKTYRSVAERFLIGQCDAVITVSDSIARYLAERYRIPTPIVILNAPMTRAITAPSDLRADLGLLPDQPLALYVGGLVPGRGIDQAVRTLVYLPDLQLAVLGPRQEATLKRTTELAENLGVRQRLHIVDPVSPEGVGAYIASADVSLILLRNTCLNHKFCFPNKLLQSLLSGLPVVASRLVELERMVAMTGAGLIADETDPVAISEAVRRVLSEPECFRPTPTLIRSLELSHGWTTQKKNLVALYQALSGLPTDDVDHRSPSVRRGAPILSSGPSV